MLSQPCRLLNYVTRSADSGDAVDSLIFFPSFRTTLLFFIRNKQLSFRFFFVYKYTRETLLLFRGSREQNRRSFVAKTLPWRWNESDRQGKHSRQNREDMIRPRDEEGREKKGKGKRGEYSSSEIMLVRESTRSHKAPGQLEI